MLQRMQVQAQVQVVRQVAVLLLPVSHVRGWADRGGTTSLAVHLLSVPATMAPVCGDGGLQYLRC